MQSVSSIKKLAKTTHWYKYRAMIKSKKWPSKVSFQVDLQWSFKKTMENVRKQKEVSYSKKIFKKYISDRNEKTTVIINKPVYLGLSILEIKQ